MPLTKRNKIKTIIAMLIGFFLLLQGILLITTVILSYISSGGSLMILLISPAMLLILISIFFLLFGLYYRSNFTPPLKKKGIFLQIYGFIVTVWFPLIFLILDLIMIQSIGISNPLNIFLTLAYIFPSLIMGIVLGLVFIIPGRTYVRQSHNQNAQIKKSKEIRPPIITNAPSIEIPKENRYKILGIIILALGLYLINSINTIITNIWDSITFGYGFFLGFRILFSIDPLLFAIVIAIIGYSIVKPIKRDSIRLFLGFLSVGFGITFIFLNIIGILDIYNLIAESRFSEYYLTDIPYGYFYIIVGFILVIYGIYFLVKLKQENLKQPISS